MTILDEVQNQQNKLASLKAIIGFEFEDGKGIYIDAKQSPIKISEFEGQETDCTIKMKKDDLEKMLKGSLDPVLAFTLGKLKVKGSMGVAMKLSALLE